MTQVAGFLLTMSPAARSASPGCLPAATWPWAPQLTAAITRLQAFAPG
jgi:hypothetical protein